MSWRTRLSRRANNPFLPQFELSHATSGEEACAMVKAAQESNPSLCAGLR